MKENKKNRAIYEECFTGWNHGVPCIDEQDGDFTCDDNGVCIPATPLGANDYMESKKAGLQHLFNTAEIPVKTKEEMYAIKKAENPFSLYDCVYIEDRDLTAVICGEDERNLYMVDAENNWYAVPFADAPEPEQVPKENADKFNKDYYTEMNIDYGQWHDQPEDTDDKTGQQ